MAADGVGGPLRAVGDGASRAGSLLPDAERRQVAEDLIVAARKASSHGSYEAAANLSKEAREWSVRCDEPWMLGWAEVTDSGEVVAHLVRRVPDGGADRDFVLATVDGPNEEWPALSRLIELVRDASRAWGVDEWEIDSELVALDDPELTAAARSYNVRLAPRSERPRILVWFDGRTPTEAPDVEPEVEAA